MSLAPHRPRKRFAQHFLVDEQVIERMVAAVAPEGGDRVVEIGPGLGALTRGLLEVCDELDVVELDRDLARELAARLGDPPNLAVHQADALKFDFASLAGAGRRLRIVGNLPYNISTALMFRLLAQAEAVEDMHLTLQREVVERLVAKPGGRAYGRLSVMTQIACRPERLFTIPPAAFRPQPKVTSAAVRLSIHRRPPVEIGDRECFERLVRQAFSQRRKTLRNSVRGLLSDAQIRSAGVDPACRPQTLDLVALASLSNQVSGGSP